MVTLVLLAALAAVFLRGFSEAIGIAVALVDPSSLARFLLLSPRAGEAFGIAVVLVGCTSR